MKKKFLVILAFLSCLSLFAINKTQNVQAANKYGISRKYTTPKVTRGTWYYLEDGKMNKIKITAHTAAGSKLYVPSKAFFEKNVYNVSTKKRNAFIKKVMKKNIYAGYNYKKGFNVNNWVNLAGDGVYYIPKKMTVKDTKVTALRIATGAGPYTSAYAFKSPELAKAAK